MKGFFIDTGMGLFGNKKKTFVSPTLGEFTLVFSNGVNRIWSTKKENVSYTVRGTDDEPHAQQLAFLSNTKTEIEKLDTAINERFLTALPTEGIKIDFSHWKERFRITNIEVVNLDGTLAQWNIYFRDSKRGTDLTLYIEGEKLTRFSVDS